MKTVREKVLGLSKDVKILKERGQVALNDRQMRIVEFIIKKDKSLTETLEVCLIYQTGLL